jgi:Protein of unknown function (DUF2854)
MLRQTSLGSLGLLIGGILTLLGFGAYVFREPTLNLVGFFYGIPLLLGGLALKASELKPVPFTQPTSAEVLELRNQQATDTQNQIRQDVTRYRYGQSAHLDEALKRLGLSPTDEERPLLSGLHEENIAGNYGLVLEFTSPLMPIESWQQKQAKLTSFFGPNIRVEIKPLANQRIDLALIKVTQPEAAAEA